MVFDILKLMNGNNKNLFLVGLLVVVLGLGGIWSFIKYRSATNSPVADLGLVTYVNAQGQEWSIPKGEYEFKVSSAERYPKFVTGFISPLDVKVGDTQKMMVAVNSDNAIKRVWAEIETDNSVKMVELKLESSSTISVSDLKSSEYLVDKDGTLVINDGSDRFSKLLNSLVNKAEASSITQYQYSGEWLVEDTHTKTYQTRFVAEDSQGRLDSMTLAWSDPVCNYASNGSLSGDCSVSTGIEAFDGDSSIGANTMTFTGAASLIFSPGNKITLTGAGKIILGSSGSIKQLYPFFRDGDADGYASGTSVYSSSSASWSGYTRMKDINGKGTGTHYQVPATASLDCMDSNANAKPGQTSYFTTARSGFLWDSLKYDYNCDGSESKEYSYVTGSYGGGNVWSGGSNSYTRVNVYLNGVLQSDPSSGSDFLSGFTIYDAPASGITTALPACGNGPGAPPGGSIEPVYVCRTGNGTGPYVWCIQEIADNNPSGPDGLMSCR